VSERDDVIGKLQCRNLFLIEEKKISQEKEKGKVSSSFEKKEKQINQRNKKMR
jgi:hypothetical protein